MLYPDKTILLSGGFDPLHIGHVQMMQNAAKIARVIVAVNTDEWLMRKKGYIFMPEAQRIQIVQAIEGVDYAFSMRDMPPIGDNPGSDDDNTACAAIRYLSPDFFGNGGDRKLGAVPEDDVCASYGCKQIYGLGGNDKPQSSSWLVNSAMEQLKNPGQNR
jgi:D-beta-D-heptose 7-phosphate kinase/D-beta-D-heptose 1-phosphate adenosyltransferase